MLLNFLIFILQVSLIFTTEGLMYVCFQDYSFFIERLSRRLASVNILYVKIFQAVALNNRFIDENVNNKLLEFTDNAPWNFGDIQLAKLIEITDKYRLTLKQGYEIPINSGMISLVFKAYNSSGDTVIIKMKRKNIQQKLDDAISNLLWSTYILSFIPIINNYQIATLINKNIEIIRHQTNFIEEVDNLNRMRENCKGLKYVKIPNVIKEATEEYPDFIIMDYIEGLKINKVEEEDYLPFAKLVIKFGLVTTLVHGLAHGDLHGGNILFIKDMKDTKYPHKLGIIDFGIVYEAGGQYKTFLFDIFTQMFEKPPRELAEKMLNSKVIEPPNIISKLSQNKYDELLDLMEEIIKETLSSDKNVNQIQIYKFLSRFKDYLNKTEVKNAGITFSDDFVKSQLVLAMAHGVTLSLCGDKFMSLMDEVINELFHTELLLN